MRDIINEKEPLPSDISSVSKIEAIPDVGDEQKEIGSEQQSFSSFMQGKEMDATKSPTKTQAISPFDLAQIGAKPITTPNIQSLVEQSNLVQNTLKDVHTQLSTPNLNLKSSQKYLVKNKLSDVNAHLSAVNAKLGIPPQETQADLSHSKASGPISQYLGYVTDGINQLESAKTQLANISSRGPGSLAPAEFMLLQLKFNKAQQELDFTSTLLAKSIEGLKMIMNVQI